MSLEFDMAKPHEDRHVLMKDDTMPHNHQHQLAGGAQ